MHLGDNFCIEIVILETGVVTVETADFQRVDRQHGCFVENLAVDLFDSLFNVAVAEARQQGGGPAEAVIHQLFTEADHIEQGGIAVAGDGTDSHLRHDLQDSLGQGRVDIF